MEFKRQGQAKKAGKQDWAHQFSLRVPLEL